jgi:NAD(P)H-flavin reductase
VEKDEDDQFPLKVIKKELISHDTYLIELEFPNAEWISGLWAGGHYMLHAQVDGKTVSKPYTPISPVNKKGSVEFVIKIYRDHVDFPGAGKFSKNLEANVQVGDNMICEGPIGMIRYLGFGKLQFKKEVLEHTKTKIGLVAGGTGITPMYAIAQASALAKDGVQITLLFTNKSKGDILCKKELDELEKFENVKIFYTLTRHQEADGEWNGLTGRVSLEMLKQCGFPEPADDIYIAFCGPKAMNETVKGILEEGGYVAGKNFPG